MNKNIPQFKNMSVVLKDKIFSIEYFEREGTEDTILFIHGLGGAKENFYEACKIDALSSHTLFCFDHPGAGNSTYFEDVILNVDDLVLLTAQFIEKLNLQNIILAGTSMGGLISMLYMQKYGIENIKAFINIEGNLMPEDCMFSSKVVVHEFNFFKQKIYAKMGKDMKLTRNVGYHILANNMELNYNATAYYNYSFQIVAYSQSGILLDQYIAFSLPKLFIYGSENKHLSYLGKMAENNLKVAEVSNSNHFMYYDNPREMYAYIVDFINKLKV